MVNLFLSNMEKVNGVLLSVEYKDLILLKKKPTEFWKDVTSIGRDAFAVSVTLRNIKIPDGVTSIGRSAFQECMELTNVKIPDSVTSIGEFAFSDSTSLTATILGTDVTVGWYAFGNVPIVYYAGYKEGEDYSSWFYTWGETVRSSSTNPINTKNLNKNKEVIY